MKKTKGTYRTAAMCCIAAMIFACLAYAEGGNSRIGLDRIEAAIGQSSFDGMPELLMKKTAQANVRQIKIWVPWIFMDPDPPFSEQPGDTDEFLIVPGIRLGGWHRYYVGALDRAMAAAQREGLEVTLGISGPPRWPRGTDCKYDLGTSRPCGVIARASEETFKAALYDFSYYMARRYPNVMYWVVYNEPNLPYAFLPEKPYAAGSLLSAYVDLCYRPISEGLRASGNIVQLIGPEITLLNVSNEFGSTRWLEDWIEPLARDYPDIFNVISVHSYTVDAIQTLQKMTLIKTVLEKYPRATRRVWLTEFNFGTSKEPLTLTDSFIFTNILVLYSNQWWERSYFFTMLGPLLSSDPKTFGSEKPLYRLFSIAAQYLR